MPVAAATTIARESRATKAQGWLARIMPQQQPHVAAQHSGRELHDVVVRAFVEIGGQLVGSSSKIPLGVGVFGVVAQELPDHVHGGLLHLLPHVHGSQGWDGDQSYPVHGAELGEHRTSAGLQGDLGEHHGQIPVLLQHAVSGRLQQVQGLGGWIDQPVFGHLQLPAHSRIPLHQNLAHRGGDLGAEHRTQGW